MIRSITLLSGKVNTQIRGTRIMILVIIANNNLTSDDTNDTLRKQFNHTRGN